MTANALNAVPETRLRSGWLPLEAAVLDWRQQPGIVGGKAGQQFGIVAIILGLAGGVGQDLARVGHDDLVAGLVQQAADSGRVRAAALWG